ncbi:response regulator transcription factor [Petrocella sp. FN5]|uniref:response regulator transcription factor n=1 Tax=Petrocella sp. FN5 TaxID=3032002 RepID=UPI0023DCBCFB|nr:response regulator [Petrocella sp. FN5]MDF1618566.1 response regulator [Petrocella sp. FN5]
MSNYKVLVVDDEKPARELLIGLIDWEAFGFEICGEAKNGKQAFEKYEEMHPDVIITDIQMPLLDGLGLIRKIREKDEVQKFIILSCYEEFAFAREAVKMHVEDYLIKDLMKKEDLVQLLLSIRKKEVKNVEDKQQKIKNQFFLKSNSEIKEMILNNEMYRIGDQLTLDALSIYSIFIISIDDYYLRNIPSSGYNKESIKDCLLRTLEYINQDNEGTVVNEFTYLGFGKFFVLVKTKKEISEHDVSQKFSATANQIRYRFNEKDHEHTISIAIGRPFNSIQVFEEAYNQAQMLLNYRLFIGKDKNIIYSSNLPNTTRMSEASLTHKMKMLIEAINNHDLIKMKLEIGEIYKSNVKGFMQYNFLKGVNEQLGYLITDFCNCNGINHRDVFEDHYIPIQLLNEYDTVEEMAEWFTEKIENIIQIDKNKKKYSRHISDAILFIEENDSMPISLNEISEALNIHKVYLSRIFKEETGITLSKFILNHKMRKAKELIVSTNMKFYEIGERLGYSNAQHFVVAFKKNEGITPKKYRDTHKK